MFDLLKRGPLLELYNVVFYIVKESFKSNHAGCAETELKQIATKIWSIYGNDWEAL